MVPASSISCKWLQTSSTKSGGIHLNCSLKGVSSVALIICSVEWVQPNSVGSNKKALWYLAKSCWTESVNSRGHDSNPLRSSSSNSFPCLCLTVNLVVWGPWGLSAPSGNLVSTGGSGTAVVATTLATGVFSWECGGRLYYFSPPWLHSCYLSSAQCMHFAQQDPAVDSHLQFIVLGSWH